MGRVRTEMVKKLARVLVETHHEKFSTDYEVNKKSVDELVDTKSKRIRNKVAGYVTRLRMIEENKLSGEFGDTSLLSEEENEKAPT